MKECGQKQALLERTQREKKAVETDLERVREKLPAEAAKSGEALQRLQTRMHEAEQAAEEACMKRDSALMAQRATETRYVSLLLLCTCEVFQLQHLISVIMAFKVCVVC